MLKKVANWHLSILIIIVSVLSVSLVQKYVLAAWQEPTSVPGNAANQNIVLNPMTADLDLNDKALTGTNVNIDASALNAISITNSANLCLSGDCRSTWPLESAAIWHENASGIDYNGANPNVGIGTATPSQLLQVDGGNILVTNGNISLGASASIKATKNSGTEVSVLYLNAADDVLNIAGDDIAFKDLSGNNLLYIDDIGTIGNLGIGTNTPNKSLHIKTPVTVNAEIDLQSGADTHWGIYQDEATADLRFWHDNDNVVFDSLGYVGIGTSNPNHQLHVESASQDAVYGETQTAGKYGIYGENTAVGGSAMYGQGFFGGVFNSTQAGGAGLMAIQGSGNYSAMFFGDVRLYNVGTDNSYLHLATVSSDPPSTDCDSTDERGRMIYNYTTNSLFICDYDPAEPSGGGWKYDVQVSLP
ncbi:MAG: hypothetical protein WCV71_02905 [Patescibacteria group bacterium]